MRGFNKGIIAGNLTRDPELRYTPSKTAVTDLSVAINRQWTDNSGKLQEEVDYIDVTVWGKQAESCAEYLSKGSPVLVEGRITQDRWQADDGTNRSKIKITAQAVNFLPSGNIEPREDMDTAEANEETDNDIPF